MIKNDYKKVVSVTVQLLVRWQKKLKYLLGDIVSINSIIQCGKLLHRIAKKNCFIKNTHMMTAKQV